MKVCRNKKRIVTLDIFRGKLAPIFKNFDVKTIMQMRFYVCMKYYIL